MAVRTCSPEELGHYFGRQLVLISDRPETIALWSELAESIVGDPMWHTPGSPTQVVEYHQGQVQSSLTEPFTRDRLLNYCLDRAAQALRAPPEPERGIAQYTSKF